MTSSRHNSGAFIALAADLIICILRYLQPPDIISVRKTCRTLYELTRPRVVWIQTLRSLMIKHSILEATYPLHNMPSALLEHVALAPHRLLSLLARSDGAIRPLTIRLLAPRLTCAEREKYAIVDNDGLYDSYTEPSGRFLASLTAYPSFTLITIWDLGLCGNDTIKPLARLLESTPATLFLDGFYPDYRESDIFYLVTTYESSFLNPLTVIIHRVSLASRAEISFQAKLEIPVITPFITPHTSQVPGTCRLVVQYDDDDGGKHFWVWNFLDNTVAAFLAVDYLSSGGETCTYHDDCIIIAADGHFRVYNVPPLLPRGSVVFPIDQKANIVIAAPSMTSNSFFTAEDGTLNMPCYLLEITPSLVTFFEVKNNNQSSHSIPNKLPIAVGSLGVTDLSFWNRDQRLIGPRRFGNYLFLSGYSNTDSESGDLLVFTADMSEAFEGKDDAKFTKTVFSNPLPRQDVKRRQFFPLLGRVHMHARQHAAHFPANHCVYIFDYLAPPRNV